MHKNLDVKNYAVDSLLMSIRWATKSLLGITNNKN